MQKSIHTVSDALVLTDIAVLMQASEPLLFYYASTTSWEHQLELALALSLPLSRSRSRLPFHVSALSFSPQTCVFSSLFYYHSPQPNRCLFPFRFFFFCFDPWLSFSILLKEKKKVAGKNTHAPSSVRFSCLPQTHRAKCYHTLLKTR